MGWWAATGIWMLCGLLKSSVACGRTILGFLGVRKSRDWNLFRVHWTLDTETGRALARPSAWRRIAVLSHVGGRAAAWWGQRKEGYVWGLQGPELGSCLPRCGCGDCCDATIGLAWLSSPLSEPSGPVRVRRHIPAWGHHCSIPCSQQRSMDRNPCCCSGPKLCLILCDTVDCSTPDLPVPRYLPGFAQTNIHWINDAMQASHPL